MKTTITATIVRVIAEHGPLTKQQLTQHIPGLQQNSVGYLLRGKYTHVAKMTENPGRGSGLLQVYDLTDKGRKMALAGDGPAPRPPRRAPAAIAAPEPLQLVERPKTEVLTTSATVFTKLPYTLPQTFYTPPRLFIRDGAMAALGIRSKGISA